MPRWVVVGAALVGLVVVAPIALVWVFQRSLIYFPGTGRVPAAEESLPGAREVVLSTEDGLELAAWWVPAADPQAPAVLVTSGNAGHRRLRAPLARALGERGLSVLLFDYRGYGGNPGSPSEEGLARDARAARSFLLDEAEVPPQQIVYFGESLGAAVATRLAVEHPPAALVLRSPFADLASVGRAHYPFLPVRWLVRDRFPVVDQVASIDVPTTVVYGTADRVVPPEQSRAVAQAAANLHRLVEVPGADHNDRALFDGTATVDAVAELADLTARGRGGAGRP